MPRAIVNALFHLAPGRLQAEQGPVGEHFQATGLDLVIVLHGHLLSVAQEGAVEVHSDFVSRHGAARERRPCVDALLAVGHDSPCSSKALAHRLLVSGVDGPQIEVRPSQVGAVPVWSQTAPASRLGILVATACAVAGDVAEGVVQVERLRHEGIRHRRIGSHAIVRGLRPAHGANAVAALGATGGQGDEAERRVGVRGSSLLPLEPF